MILKITTTRPYGGNETTEEGVEQFSYDCGKLRIYKPLGVDKDGHKVTRVTRHDDIVKFKSNRIEI